MGPASAAPVHESTRFFKVDALTWKRQEVKARMTDRSQISQPQPAAIFDDAVFLGQLAGDRNLATRLVSLALADMAPQLATLAEAVATADWPTAQRGAHTLKSAAGQLGGRQLAEHCGRLEAQLRAGGTADGGMVEDVSQGWRRLADALEAWRTQPD